MRLHFLMSLLLGVCMIPLLLWRGIPVKFDWHAYLVTYWVSLSIQSIFLSVLLYLTGFRGNHAVQATWRFYSEKKPRLIIAIVLLAESIWLIGILRSIIIGVTVIALVEFSRRIKVSPSSLHEMVSSLLLPASYLFLGFIIVFGYNNIIASLRFYGAYDPLFNSLDSWALSGLTVSKLSRVALSILPIRLFRLLEFIYFGMFPQIGAGIILIGLCHGRRRAMELVGCILTSYYIALGCYCLWPSLGPFYLCPNHFSDFNKHLETYSIQKTLLSDASLLWQQGGKPIIGLDYLIAFPCMHIAQPLIVMGFLRGRPRIVYVLIVYDIFLLAAIILLEWHYVVDILGGIAIALLSLKMHKAEN